jgi:hypothetical protein
MESEVTTPQFPSEFMSDGDMYRLFSEHGFMMGRMISGSKSGYREIYPNHEVVFNANIVLASRGKVWYGDLDLTLDSGKIQEISTKLGEPIYVLREMDARFENEDKDIAFYKFKAVKVFKP